MPARTWITDFTHLVPLDDTSAPLAARRRSDFTREVVEAGTSRKAGPAWQSAVRCIGRVGRRLCRAYVQVRFDGSDTVEWSCARCGDVGAVSRFRNTQSDLSSFVPRGKVVAWGFDDQERKMLMLGTEWIPELRAVVARASPYEEVPGLLLVSATVPELDAIYTLVEELTDLTRSRQGREVLDGLRFTLSTSIDGF